MQNAVSKSIPSLSETVSSPSAAWYRPGWHQRWHQGLDSAHQPSSFVGSDELSFVEDVPLYGGQEFIFAQARWCIKLSVQGVYLEVVVMNSVASGWHAAVVTHLTEIVYALQGSLGATFRKPSAIRRDLVGHPVDERLLCGCIRIIADERYLFGPLGRCAPPQGWGDILSFSRVPLRDGGARFESGARHFYGHCFP